MTHQIRTLIAIGLTLVALSLFGFPALTAHSGSNDTPTENRLIALEKLTRTLNEKIEELEGDLASANYTIAQQQATIEEQRGIIAGLRTEQAAH